MIDWRIKEVISLTKLFNKSSSISESFSNMAKIHPHPGGGVDTNPNKEYIYLKSTYFMSGKIQLTAYLYYY